MSQSGDPFGAVNPGAPARPSARTENALRAAGKKHANTKFGLEGAEGNYGSPRGAVRVRNTISAFLDEYTLVGLNGAAVPLDDDTRAVDADPVFNAGVPGYTFAGVASLREPAGYFDVVEAITHGPAVVRVNVEDAAHRFATIAPGTLYLTSNASFGVPILEKQTGTGLKLAVVMLGGDLFGPGGIAGYSGISAIGQQFGTTTAGGTVWTTSGPGSYLITLRGAGYHKVRATVPAYIAGQAYQFGLAWRFATSLDGGTWTPSAQTYPIVSGHPSYYGGPPPWFITGVSTFEELMLVGSQDLYVTVQIGAFCVTGGITFGTPLPQIPGYNVGAPMGQIVGEKVGTNYGFG